MLNDSGRTYHDWMTTGKMCQTQAVNSGSGTNNRQKPPPHLLCMLQHRQGAGDV